MTLSIATLSRRTLGLMMLGIMTLGILTLSITALRSRTPSIAVLRLNDACNNDTPHSNTQHNGVIS